MNRLQTKLDYGQPVLRLGWCGLEIRDVVEIAKRLKTNSVVTTLLLQSNKFGDEGSRALADMLRVNTTVSKLDLFDNEITDVGATYFARALKVNSTVRNLNFQSNPIKDKGAKELAEMLKVNRTLEYLGTSEAPFTYDGLQYFVEALEFNWTLRSLGGTFATRHTGTERRNQIMKRLDENSAAKNDPKVFVQAKAKGVLKQVLLNGNSCAWGRVKLMLIGQGRAGKTSTIKSLLHQDFDPLEASTVGAISGQQASTTDWKQTDRLESETENLAIRAAIESFDGPPPKAFVQAELEEPLDMDEASNQVDYLGVDFGDNQDDNDEDDDDFLEIPEMALANVTEVDEENKESLDEAILERFDPVEFNRRFEKYGKDEAVEIRLNIWDYGGQAVFHTLHQLLMTRYGAYLLCFDLRDVDTEDLEYWLSSVNLHAPEAPLMLIGTFADQVNDYVSVNKKLRKLLHDIKTRLVENTSSNLLFFPLDNSTRNGIENIRDGLNRAIQGEPYVHQPVPLSWMKVLDVFEKHELMHIERVKELSKAFDVKDVGKMLQFFHELGVVLHFTQNRKVSSLVITNPQWFIDAVACIIFDDIHYDASNVPAGLIPDFQRFRKEAILPKDLATYLWSPLFVAESEFLIEVLSSLQLLCSWSDNLEFLVPSQLQNNVNLPRKYHGGMKATWKRSKGGKIPDGVFERLICLCVQKARKFELPIVSKHLCYFSFDGTCSFELSFSTSPNGHDLITATMDSSTTNTSKGLIVKSITTMMRAIDCQSFHGRLQFVEKI